MTDSYSVVSTADGKPLYTMADKLLATHKTFIGRNAQDETHKAMFSISKHHLHHGVVELTFANPYTHRVVCLTMTNGDLWGGSTDITADGRVVAEVRKAKEEGAGKGVVVTIMPGVDVALVAALCIAVDGMKKQSFTGWYIPDGPVPFFN